jgi:hypothetical protein
MILSPMGICVGKYPYLSSQGVSRSGSNAKVISSHTKSLFFDDTGILNSHPPMVVAVSFSVEGTGR